MNKNYAEDANNIFRFDYSKEFLRWAITPPGWRLDWLVGVRNGQKQLVASIIGIPVTISLEEERKKAAEINFLCINKQYRSLKLTPLLIEEVSRRIKLRDKWLAVSILPYRYTQLVEHFLLLSQEQTTSTVP
jgi:glycylpeptide N-tetradecanoyltransferase